MTDKPRSDDASPAKPRLSPSSFMRARRPERYSDSIEDATPALDRSFFEYHLDTLTNRSDEKPFEHFCRKLAQKELCPNLIPQTGPTGGGDSKVDTETYPVAPELADRWYEGSPAAGSERWGFAISAKKDWRSKVRSDVQKIAATKRGYKLIYFLSNQFIKDKDRSTVEDELTKEFGIPVRILDRTWIVDRVFEREHFALAIDALNISGSPAPKKKRTGALDAERQARLSELEAQIADPDRYVGIEYELAEDCLDAANLSRELELSRIETDGRFERAQRIADKVDSSQQRLRVRYDRAWTSVYWFDDYLTLNSLYDGVAELALKSNRAHDLELLCNIWTTLMAGVRAGSLTEDQAKIPERTAALKARLYEVAAEKERPNNAAHVRTLICTVQITEEPGNADALGHTLRQLAEIFREAEYLGGYPFDQYANFFEELGNLFGPHPAYDETFEVLLPILERRRSEGAAGSALLKRGAQKLRSGQRYEAIRLLGRAQQKLIKHEHRRELVACLILCADAYTEARLPWAAHSNLLAAASIALSDFFSDGRVGAHALSSIEQLVWNEIRLGRLPHVLTYIRFQHLLAAHLQLDEENKEKFQEQLRLEDFVLSILLLRSSLSQLRTLERLPRTLEKLGLFASEMALLFALGHEDAIAKGNFLPEGTPVSEAEGLLKQLAVQPAGEELPLSPELFDESCTTFKSVVLGCEWSVKVDTTEIGIGVGESLLGFVEAFFATTVGSDAIAHRQEVKILISAKKGGATGDGFQVSVNDPDYIARIEYPTSYDPNREPVEGQLGKFLRDTLGILIARVLYVSDMHKYFERIGEVEEGLGRSLAFANVFASASNVVGTTAIYNISEWLDDAAAYPLKRAAALDLAPPAAADDKPATPRFGEGSPPPEFMDLERLRHGQRRVLSVIEMELWDKANWCGVAVASYDKAPPVLGLMFRNEEPARQIFRNWRKKYGERDEKSVIRVAVIQGVDRNKPSSYTLTISTDLEKVLNKAKEFEQFAVMSRAKRVDMADPKNLRAFLALYERWDCYILAPAIVASEGTAPPRLFVADGILKRGLYVRQAWQVGDHDPDFVAVLADDEPIIPDGITDPPVARLLKRRREKSDET